MNTEATTMLDEALLDFETRAAIHEHDAGIKRANAESLALREVVATYGQETARAVHAKRRQEW